MSGVSQGILEEILYRYNIGYLLTRQFSAAVVAERVSALERSYTFHGTGSNPWPSQETSKDVYKHIMIQCI